MSDDSASATRSRPRLAVFVSGGGRSLENLAEAIDAGALDAEIALVISNRRRAFGLERARRRGIPSSVLRPRDFASRDAWEAETYEQLRSAQVDYVCLLGYLELFPIRDAWKGRILNIHPALLPDFGGPGMYGAHVHRAVIESGVRESGCTVHLCDEEYDRGEILLQRRCPVELGDDADALAARVFEEEKRAVPDALRILFARDGRAPAPAKADEVLFDLDGTLIDSIGLIVASYEHTLAKHGKPASTPASILAHVGVPLAQHLRVYTDDEDEIAAMTRSYRAWNFENHDRLVRPYPGVRELLEELRAAKRRVGVVTSKMHEAALRGLAHCGLDDLVDFVTGADDVERHKPDPLPLARGAERLACELPRCAYVGDSFYDMQAARSGGARALGAAWGPFEDEILRRAGADALLRDPRDVLGWLTPR